jgi:hypothetical protein
MFMICKVRSLAVAALFQGGCKSNCAPIADWRTLGSATFEPGWMRGLDHSAYCDLGRFPPVSGVGEPGSTGACG